MIATLITGLNDGAATFVAGYAWPLIWQSSLLIMLIALAAKTVFRKASPRCRYLLWCLVIVRLVLPPALDLPTSVAHWGIPAVAHNTAALEQLGTTSFTMPPIGTANGSGPIPQTGPRESAHERSGAAPPHSKASLSPASVLLGAWGAGVAGLVVLLAVRLLRHRRLLSRSQAAPPVIAALVAECGERLGIRRRVQVRCVDGLQSPIACGVFAPKIVLPSQVAEAMHTNNIRPVIIHELVHVKRHDAAVNWLQLALGILHFYNPLVWYANRQIRAEREGVCDDLVLMALDLDRETYAASLVEVAQHSQASGLFAPGYVGVVEKRSNLRGRVRRILNHRVRPTTRLSVLSILALIVFAASFGTLHATPDTSGGPLSRGQLLRRIEEQEAKFRYVSFDSHWRLLGRDNEEEEWAETPVTMSAAVKSSGVPAGKARIEMRQVLPGKGGMPPYSGDEFRLAYNGLYGTRAEIQSGPYDEMTPIHFGWIMSERPTGLDDYRENVGLNHTLNHFYSGMSFSQMLQNPWYDVSIEESSGDSGSALIRVDVSGLGGLLRVFYLDPARGYTIQRRERFMRSGASSEHKLVYDSAVTEMTEVASGFWMPVDIETYWTNLESEEKYHTSLENIVAQDEMDPTVFTIVFPEGYTVEDKRDGVRYKVDANTAELPPWDKSRAYDSPLAVDMQDGDRVAASAAPPPEPGPAPQDGTEGQAGRVIEAVLRPEHMPERKVLDLPKGKIVPKQNADVFVEWGRLAGEAFESTAGLTYEGVVLWTGPTKPSHKVRREKTSSGAVRYIDPSPGGGIAIADLWVAEKPEDLPAMPASPDYGGVFIGPLGKPDTDLEAWPLPYAYAFKTIHGDVGVLEITKFDAKDLTVHLRYKFLARKNAAASPAPVVTCAPEADPFARPTVAAALANTFSGTVIDKAGAPLTGVRVHAWTWCPGNETNSAADGRFKLEGFDPDQHTIEVRFTKDGYSPVYMFRQPVGRLTEPIVMGTGTYFEGIVKDPQGQPVPDAVIRADGGPRQTEGVRLSETLTQTKSGPNGRYRFHVQHGTYKLTVAAEADIAEMPSVAIAEDEAKHLDFQLAEGATFRARIVDTQTGAPVEGFRLFGWHQEEVSGTSDADGNIEMPGMPSGTFKFFVEAEEQGIMRWWSADCLNKWHRYHLDEARRNWQRNFDYLEFNVQPGMTPVTIKVERGARIHGTVLDPNGNPVAGATVAPALTGTGNSITGDTRFSVESNEDGRFDMILPASKLREYNIIVHDGKHNQWRKWANGAMAPITTQPGEVLDGVVIRLTHPCVIRGRVVDEAGIPVANREVRAVAFEANDNRYYVPTVRTRKNGSFTLRHVHPGKHYSQVAPFSRYAPNARIGTNQIVETDPDKPVEGIRLVAQPQR